MSLKVQIDLGSVRDRVASTAKVFVFVRESGQRMPLGVEQFTVATLPANVEFHTTNNYSAVTVIARVSPSGRVEKSPDDFEVSAIASFGHPAPVVGMSFDGGPNSAVNPSDNLAASVTKGVVTVNLALDLPRSELEKLSDSARVFVVAKSPGSPIPVAVKAFPVDAVPNQLKLSDADAMMPTRTLSMTAEIQLSAHISRSGDVSRDVGDWEGFAEEPSASAPKTYNIRLDKQIQ